MLECLPHRAAPQAAGGPTDRSAFVKKRKTEPREYESYNRASQHFFSKKIEVADAAGDWYHQQTQPL